MTELVKYLVLELIENKDAAVITQEGEVIRISVDKKDMGKVIGRQGKIAKAIRTIVKAAGMKDGKKYTVEIIDAEDGGNAVPVPEAADETETDAE